MNERMPDYIAQEFVSLIENKFESASGTKVLIFGLAYKENVRDTRDTKVVNLVRALGRFGVRCHVLDPHVDEQIARNILGEAEFSNSLEELSERDFSGAIITVAHEEFKQYSPSIVRKFMKPSSIIFDIKNLFPRDQVDGFL
jgi:UDP-N-acetyl-D-galactosamine dehydrogenase